MSRKDSRRTLLVALGPSDLEWLRNRAQGRSLGDTVRRTVEAGLARTVHDVGYIPSEPQRRLPVQLPKMVRSKVETLAQNWNKPREYVVWQAIRHSQSGPTDPE